MATFQAVSANVLKRAKHRCELCGGHEDQVALHVDHIIPRSKGGPDDTSNFQALCMTCNTNKRDTDDTDFRGVLDSYSDREAGCIFCEIGAERIIAENELCFAINDASLFVTNAEPNHPPEYIGACARARA